MDRDEKVNCGVCGLSDEETAEFERVLVEGYELAKAVVQSPVFNGASVSVVLTALATAYGFVVKRCNYPMDFAMKLIQDRLLFVDEHVSVMKDGTLINAHEPAHGPELS